MIRYLYLIFFVLITSVSVIAQPAKYTVANIHAHNDYQYNIPFEQAHLLALGSVEVDLVLLHDTLFVAHAVKEIQRGLLFENAYLQKISNALQKNNNYVFADSTRVLQLLIDIKTDSLQTLDAVIRSIRNYPALLDNPSIRFVITGRQPPASQFKNYPSFIFFDGNINNSQHLSSIDRIGLFSDNFKKYTQWNGKGVLTNKDLVLVKEVIEKAHQLGKPIRFWAAPDNINTWYQMMELGIDYINTDHITEAARFMNTLPATTSQRLARQDKKEILIQLSGWVNKTDQRKNKRHEVFEPSFHRNEFFSITFLKQKTDYVHQNPCKAGMVNLPEDYVYSSKKYYYNGMPEIYPVITYMELQDIDLSSSVQ